MADVTIKAPPEVLDQFAGITGLFPLTPAESAGATPPFLPSSDSSGPLTPNWNPAAPSTPGTGAPDVGGALPPIAPASAPASMASPAPAEGSSDYYRNQVQQDTQRKMPGGVLGKIGGYALSALVPHVAALVPDTPLGKIAAVNRDTALEQGAQKSEEEARAAQSNEEMKNAQIQAMGSMVPVRVGDQTFYLHEKDAANVIGKQIQGGATVEAAGERAAGTVQAAGERADASKDAAGNRAQPTKTTVGKDGKNHIMERDPKTGEYSIDRGIAPQSYGQSVLPTKTIQGFDANGQPTVLGWNEQTQRYDIPQAASSSGAAGHEIFQAGAVERAGNDLIGAIQQNKNKFGDMQAILNSAFLGTPLSDPVSSGLASQIKSFAALNPAMHGFRGKDALNEFVKLLGGLPNNPDSLVAGIQGILKTAGAIRGEGQGKGPAVGTVEDGYRFKGGDPSKKENWEKAQ